MTVVQRLFLKIKTLPSVAFLNVLRVSKALMFKADKKRAGWYTYYNQT